MSWIPCQWFLSLEIFLQFVRIFAGVPWTWRRRITVGFSKTQGCSVLSFEISDYKAHNIRYVGLSKFAAARAVLPAIARLSCFCRRSSRSSSDDGGKIPARVCRLYIWRVHPGSGSHRILGARRQWSKRPALLLVILITMRLLTSCLLIALTTGRTLPGAIFSRHCRVVSTLINCLLTNTFT